MKYCFVFVLIVFGTVTTEDIVPQKHWAKVLQGLIDANKQRVDTMLKLYHMQENDTPKYSSLRAIGKKQLADYLNNDEENRKSLIIYIAGESPLKKYRLERGGEHVGISIEVPPTLKKVNIPAKNNPVNKPALIMETFDHSIEEPDLTVGLNLTTTQKRMLRKKWFSSCEKKASKLCQRACKDAFKAVCQIFTCKSKMKSKMSKECKKVCKSKFKLGSGHPNDSGSESGGCGGDRSD